jgi:hypothetical protein
VTSSRTGSARRSVLGRCCASDDKTLRQQQKVSVLEWLAERFVTWQDWDPSTIEPDARAQGEMPGAIRLERVDHVERRAPLPGQHRTQPNDCSAASVLRAG